MPPDDRDLSFLWDVVVCCDDIVNFTSDVTQEEFASDRMRRLATERQLEILGEAANHVSAAAQDQWTVIDWTRIIGLRNKLPHDYGEVLAERIWIISREFVPKLLTVLR